MIGTTLAKLSVLADGVNPEPEAPPGMEGLTQIINWVAWGVTALCVVAFLGCAGWLAISVFSGQEIRAGKGLIIVLIAAVLIGAASAIFAIVGM